MAGFLSRLYLHLSKSHRIVFRSHGRYGYTSERYGIQDHQRQDGGRDHRRRGRGSSPDNHPPRCVHRAYEKAPQTLPYVSFLTSFFRLYTHPKGQYLSSPSTQPQPLKTALRRQCLRDGKLVVHPFCRLLPRLSLRPPLPDPHQSQLCPHSGVWFRSPPAG